MQLKRKAHIYLVPGVFNLAVSNIATETRLSCAARLAAAGVNAVRLPVGHWVLAETGKEAAPFVEGGAR